MPSKVFQRAAAWKWYLLAALLLVYAGLGAAHGGYWVLRKLLWKNATNRPPILIVAILFGWKWATQRCQMANMDLEKIIGSNPRQTALPAVRAGMSLLLVVLIMRLIHLLEVPGMRTWRPWLTTNLSIEVVFCVLFVMPFPILAHAHRMNLLRTLWDSIIAPFAPVTFWHVLVADYLTSMAKAFSDFQLTFCIASQIYSSSDTTTRTTNLWEGFRPECQGSVSNAVMLALPFWWRLMQCLHVYSKTYEQKNLWNALKYSTAFPVVVVSYYRRLYPSENLDSLWLLAVAVNSSYCFVWDVLMDWGLFKWENGGWKLELREGRLISQSSMTYYGLAVFNLSLRFLWTMKVFGLVDRGGGMFLYETLEIMRRTVWAVFRMEWEYLVKVTGIDYKPVAVNDTELGPMLSSQDSEGDVEIIRTP